MNKFKNFKNYLLQQDDGYRMALNEGIMEIRDRIWPHMNIFQAMTVLKCMPGWQPKMTYGFFVYEIGQESVPSIKQMFSRSTYNFKYEIKEDVSGNTGGPIIPVDVSGEKNPMQKVNRYRKMLSDVLQLTDNAQLIKFMRPQPTGIAVVSEDKAATETIFAAAALLDHKQVIDALDEYYVQQSAQTQISSTKFNRQLAAAKDDAERQKIRALIKADTDEMRQKVKDGGEAEKTVRQELQRNANAAKDALTDEIQKIGLTVTDDIRAKVEKAGAGEKTNVKAKLKVEDYLPRLMLIFNAVDEFSKLDNVKKRDTADEAGDRLVRLLTQTEQASVPKASVHADYQLMATDIMSQANALKFADSIKFESDIPELSRAVLSMSNGSFSEYVKQNPNRDMRANWSDWMSKFNESNIAMLISTYQKMRNQQLVDVKDGKLEQDKVLKNIMEYKTLDDLTSAVNAITDEVNAENEKKKRQSPNLRTPLARRRMKLFASLKHYGGEVYSNADWVMGWSFTVCHSHIWGRPKPNCVKGHPTEVFEPANYDDWEEGHDRQYDSIRDNIEPGYEFVKDSPIPALNKYISESAFWCTANQGRRKWYVDKSDMDNSHKIYSGVIGPVLIQLMDCSTGLLYQIGNSGYFLSENDENYGILADIQRKVGDDWGKKLEEARKRYPTLNSLFEESHFDDRCMKSKNAHRVYTLAEQLQKAKAEKRITQNGAFRIEDQTDEQIFGDVIKLCDELIPVKHTPGNLNWVFNLGNHVINCENVTYAAHMFQDLNTMSPVRLSNTNHIMEAGSMFQDAVIPSISGLDTSSVEHARSMFENCTHPHRSRISVKHCNFDMRSCTDMPRAFTESDLERIVVTNLENVTDMRDAFVGCSMIGFDSIPDPRTMSSIISGSQLRSKFNGDYRTVFDGCDTLRKTNPDVFEQLAERYAATINDTKKNKRLVDSRGFLKISSQTDARLFANQFIQYPGVVLTSLDDNDNADAFFTVFDQLDVRIKTLDVNGRRNINMLFNACNIYQLDNVIGTENVATAAAMFNNCSISTIPQLDFPSYTGVMFVFRNCRPPKRLPRNLNFGACFNTALDPTNSKFVQALADDVDNINMAEINPGGDIVDIDENAARGITLYLIGRDYADKWTSSQGAKRVAQLLYLWHVKKASSKFAATIKTDDRKYAILDEKYISNSEFVRRCCDFPEQVKGFVIDPSVVDKINMQGSQTRITCFAELNVKHLPKIDLTGVKCADCMFKGSTLSEFDGLEGTKDLTSAVAMFKGAIVSKLETFDVSNIRNANEMFMNMVQTGNSGIGDKKWEFKSAIECQNMFARSQNVIGSVEDIIAIDIPAAQYADHMFQGVVLIGNDRVLPRIEYKNVISAKHMFEQTNLTDVTSISFPEATDVCHMFESCRSLRTVKIFSAPKAVYCSNVFNICAELEWICKLHLPSATDCTYIFGDCRKLGGIMVPTINPNANFANSTRNAEILTSVFGKECCYLVARNKILGIQPS